MAGVLGGLKDEIGGEGSNEDDAGEVVWGLESLGRPWT